jgi:hypothetical protein
LIVAGSDGFTPVSDRNVSGSQQLVEVVGQQGPSVTGAVGVTQEPPQPLDEIVAAGIAPKNLAALDASANDMVQRTGCIDVCFVWHDSFKAQCHFHRNTLKQGRPL